MSSAGEFKEDAFISYRHLDNNLGWVDEFHERLEYILGELLGDSPAIWRDSRMPGNVYIAEHLEERIRQTIVLVSILTPGYRRSGWCMGELKEFCRLACKNGGLQVKDKLRIFKVIKTFIERDQHPEEFQQMTGYEFYEIDQATKRPREFGTESGPNKDKRYWDKLNDLAWDIKQVLESVRPKPLIPSGNLFADEPSKGAVYLAETTYDLTEERNKIKRELQERGYVILPDKEFHYVLPDYEKAVRECLERCKLSVHLIGETYGIIPDRAGNRSVVRLQNDIAAERSTGNGFSRLIWMPKELKPKEEEQSKFIEYLKTSANPQRGAEFLQTSLEELKTVIQKRLSSNGRKPPGPPPARKKIYLICDSRDIDNIAPINDYLFEKGYDVILPLIDEGSVDSQAIEMHNENLLQCDAILIYYGNGNQFWFDHKRRDLDKIAGLEQNVASERVKPLLAKAIYLTGSLTPHKKLFKSVDPPVIRNLGEFSPPDLDDFLNEIESAQKGESNDGN